MHGVAEFSVTVEKMFNISFKSFPSWNIRAFEPTTFDIEFDTMGFVGAK